MENNIYIPGDLVIYKEKIRIIKEPRDKNHFDLREPETNLRVCYVPINEMSGVELTPEILEKNGWEFVERRRDEDEFEWSVFSKDGVLPDLYYYPTDGNDFSVFVCGSEAYPNIKYVHQLQHFLFGLGLDYEMEV